MWGADRINNIYPPMNLCPGDGYQTLTCSTAPTAPHKREQQYARIRLVFDGRTEGCRLRIHASRAAPVGRWSPMSAHL